MERSVKSESGKSSYQLVDFCCYKCLGSALTRDGYCTREIKMRIVTAKETFNRKMSLLTSNLNIELRKKLVRCFFWEHYFIWLRELDTKKIRAEVFGDL